MRKLYLLAVAVALIPVVDATGCGGNNDSSGGGGAVVAAGGGQIQNFDYSVKVTWTILGKPADAAQCAAVSAATSVRIDLDGTENPDEHGDKTADCSAGAAGVTFSGLSRIGTGANPIIDATLLNATMNTIFVETAMVIPAPGTVNIVIDFEPPTVMMTAATTSDGSSNGGMGGMGGNGGNNGGNGGAGGNGGGATTTAAAGGAGGKGGN